MADIAAYAVAGTGIYHQRPDKGGEGETPQNRTKRYTDAYISVLRRMYLLKIDLG